MNNNNLDFDFGWLSIAIQNVLRHVHHVYS